MKGGWVWTGTEMSLSHPGKRGMFTVSPHPRPISGPHALPPYVATAPDVDLFKQKSSVGTSNNTISPSTTAGAGLAVACTSGVTQLITSDTRINYWNLNYSNTSLGLFNNKKPDGYAATTPAHYLIPGTEGLALGRMSADPPPSGRKHPVSFGLFAGDAILVVVQQLRVTNSP